MGQASGDIRDDESGDGSGEVLKWLRVRIWDGRNLESPGDVHQRMYLGWILGRMWDAWGWIWVRLGMDSEKELGWGH